MNVPFTLTLVVETVFTCRSSCGWRLLDIHLQFDLGMRSFTFAKTVSTFRTYRSYFLGVKLGHFIRISPAAIRSNFVRYLNPKLDHGPVS